MQGFEWPEFRPGDRVLKRKPSEEAPPYPCGCYPARAYSERAREKGLPLDRRRKATVTGGLMQRNVFCTGCGANFVSECLELRADDTGKLFGALPIDLELLEAAP